MKLKPSLTLDKYRIVQQLDAGGMGTVYRAEHVEIAKPVALKVLSSALATDPIAQARFLREAESRLEHRQVVRVTDFGSDNGITTPVSGVYSRPSPRSPGTTDVRLSATVAYDQCSLLDRRLRSR